MGAGVHGHERTPQPSTLDPRPSTLNPQPSTLNPQPSTLDPQPSTLNPGCGTQSLNPYLGKSPSGFEIRTPKLATRSRIPNPATRNPNSENRNPKFERRKTKPGTPNPKPQGLNPKHLNQAAMDPIFIFTLGCVPLAGPEISNFQTLSVNLGTRSSFKRTNRVKNIDLYHTS